MTKHILLFQMSQNSSISSSSMNSQSPPCCSCGLPCQLKTSWTEENPGKIFYRCQNFDPRIRQGGCKYFKWATHEAIDGKAKELLMSMKNKINALERENLILKNSLYEADQRLDEVRIEFGNKLDDLVVVIASMEVEKHKVDMEKQYMVATIENLQAELQMQKKHISRLWICLIICIGYVIALQVHS
ncbi:hypothetical protein Ancab_040015 [Ancistrocladus abbreviatus]